MTFARPRLPTFLVKVIPALLLAPLLLAGLANAAITDISNAPLFTSSVSVVKPNVMFIMDDSGSMKSDYLPDEANFAATKYGKKAAQCNGVAYDPTVTYTLPVDATGTAVVSGSLAFITPDPVTQTDNHRNLSAIPLAGVPTATSGTFSFTVTSGSRRTSWYDPGDTVTIFQDSTRYFVGTVSTWNKDTGVIVLNMTGGIVAGPPGAMASPKIGDGQPTLGSIYYTYSGSQAKLSYTYTSSGVITSTTFYKECNSTIGSALGSSVFSTVTVSISSSEKQNYANWYQYYRTRMTMMKSSISLAFKGLDDHYRVGYSAISEETAAQGTKFLHIRNFDKDQKAAFYQAFNGATPTSYTPLRAALSKAGQYYAYKARSQDLDPVQYSCQRNYTILSTDGYWNTPDESTSSPKYGPYRLDNSTLVGQQDGFPTLSPMRDGGNLTKTTTDVWTTTAVTSTTTVTPVTVVTTRTSGTITMTPISGYSKITYSLPLRVQVSSMGSRPANSSPYWVNVTTVNNHNFEDDDVVTITYSGGSAPGYVGSVAIDKTGDKTFRYRAIGGTRPANNPPGSGSNYTATRTNTCAAGTLASRQTQTRDELTVSTSTLTTGTTTNSTSTSVLTRTDTQPYSQTVTEFNGVVTNDTGAVQGSLVRTNTTTVTTTSSTVTTTNVLTSAGANTFTPWVNSGSSSMGCEATIPVPGESSPVATGATTSATTAPVAATTTGPTTTTGTVVITRGDPTSGAGAKVTTVTNTPSGGVSDTLADVAAYYYNNDLRSPDLSNCTGARNTNICANNVSPQKGDAAHSYGDTAEWQHMTTFTLGLGVSGLLSYKPDYLTSLSGDFFQIVDGTKSWPAPGPSKSAENIDDLWHAAVNGRGQYFSAGDPNSLVTSLNSALNSVLPVTGAAAAASTSSLQPVEGDNDIYVAKFRTVEWSGDLESYKILSTGAITSTPTWSAAAQLDAKSHATRAIYYPSSTTLKPFNWENLTADSLTALFDGFCSKTGASGVGNPQQCATSLTPVQKTAADLGSNLVTYLRGDQTLSYYRSRARVLGDVINASPLFIGKPNFKYTDSTYTAFVSAKASRTAVVLAAANDGMLHAFDRVTGAERWAYIPSFVMPNLYKLADTNYPDHHSYFVDGPAQVGDIYADGEWKTIVVGGLGAGGRGYYALDVTDPIAPKLLWEFSDPNLGLTFGNPIITKNANGTWVVVFASGYNNVTGTGDGNGHLFVRNAFTGAAIKDIATFTTGSTPAGTPSQPSGLAKINAWIDSETNNLARRFYGGDLLGNVWRFDIDDLVQPHQKALRLAELRLSDGTTVQPITTRPALGEVDYNAARYAVVYVATGKYLGEPDLTNTTQQSLYAIKDPLRDEPWGDIRNGGALVTQTISGTNTRTITSNAVDWANKAGWKVDFPTSGERVNVNPQLAINTLVVGTNVPGTDVCDKGGQSYLYKFDISTGSTPAGEANVGTFFGNVLIQGLTIVQVGSTESSPGTTTTMVTDSSGKVTPDENAQSSLAGELRRTSWRELVD